jgi:omega-6 fatty acid desaturase (delta-12 desaturase)
VGTGAFPIITTRMWCGASPAQRIRYRATRHPLIVLFAYITVFLYGITLESLLRDPKVHWDSAL